MGNLPLGQNFIFGNEVFVLSDGGWAIVGVRVPGSMGGGLGNLLMEGVGFGWWDLLCMCSWICVRSVFCTLFFLMPGGGGWEWSIGDPIDDA